VRLWVNGNLLVDKWGPQPEIEWCSNTPVNLVSAWVGTSGGYIDTIVLPATGTYTVVLDPRGDATGSTTVTLYDVPADITDAVVVGGSAATVNIGTPGQNGAVTFSGTAGQRVRLAMSGVSIPGTDVTIVRDPISLPLAAGQQYSVQMEYFEAGGAAFAKLKWSSPTSLKQILPQEFLTPPGGPSGSGLKGEYYNTMTISGTPLLIRTDPVIDSNWTGISPGSGIPRDGWSVRWTGQVQAEYSEPYTFCTESDDGARLWVNGNLLIDKWVPQLGTEWCSNTPVNLTGRWVGAGGTSIIDPIVLPATGTYTIAINPGGDATGSITLTLSETTTAPAAQPTSLSISPSTVPQGGCFVTTVGNATNMVIDVQFTFNNGSPITVYSWGTLDSTGQYTTCAGANEEPGTYRIVAVRNQLNSDWVLVDAALAVTPKQPTSLTMSPSIISPGGCFVTNVGNGANMTIDVQWTYNSGSPETVYSWASLDSNGQATVCASPDEQPGLYTIVAVRNRLNSEWVPVSATLTVEN